MSALPVEILVTLTPFRTADPPSILHSQTQPQWLCRQKTATQHEDRQHSEITGTSADDRPGRFPDLLSYGWAEQRCHPQRQFCHTGDVSRDDPLERRRREGPLERRTNNMTDDPTQDDLDNHANQCNPNNDEYWNSRGEGDDD